jgi:AcrR family transcriptional regulator
VSSEALVAAALPAGDTKAQLKAAAQLLFARYGVNAVTVQQIVNAAGQRNNAALHYHFGDKDELIRQLVVDGAKVLDQRRREMLNALEIRGRPPSVRDILVVLVMPVFELSNDARWAGYVRFTSNLQSTNRAMLRPALNSKWNGGYVACLAHLKALLPAIPEPLIDQRLSILGIYANAILSAREAALDTPTARQARFWQRRYTLENILDTLEATITCKPSSTSLALVSQS